MERDHGLEVVKLNNKDMLRTLENAVRFGRPVLLEDVGQVGVGLGAICCCAHATRHAEHVLYLKCGS